MTLVPIDHVGLFLNYVSWSYDIDLVIDIVHKNALDEFLKCAHACSENGQKWF